MGSYDMRLHHSLRVRIVNMLRRLLTFTNISIDETEELLLDWVRTKCYDPDMLIENVVRTETGDFRQMYESSSEQFRKCMVLEDLPDTARVLRYNDYVDIESLNELYYSLLNRNKEGVL